MKTAIIIVAAGRGQRAGEGLPKQYRQIHGEPVLTKTLRRFGNIPSVGPVIVAIHPDDQELFDQACSAIPFAVQTVHGGETRTASVFNALLALEEHAPDLVLIHDGARPFVSTETIDGVIKALRTHKAVAPALPIVDAVKTVQGDQVDRNTILRVQTPQGFHYPYILDLYKSAAKGASFADDIEIARLNNDAIHFTAGDETNIKLTYESDFSALRKKISMRIAIGNGFDVHRIIDGDSLTLCGITISAGFSLLGHSDADVGLHAITDAILGAIAQGDIGDHFPPDDAQWKGAKSDIFLSHACSLVEEMGGEIENIDLTLICERPKIKPHRLDMRSRIAEIANLDLNRVSVKATTTEGLGFTGRGEGIAAQASVSISIPND